MNTISPRTLKGFRDFLSVEVWQRKKIMQVFIDTFEKYGFEPLETPVLEYFDILMGKYGDQEKLVYNFEDFGGRKVAMKYDLTVPASRVLAQYPDKFILPWKRYQIQTVWRADNTQKGRFREFVQCDADVFGTISMTSDAEFISMGIEILNNLGFVDFQVRISNRKLLNAFAKYINAEDKFMPIVFVVDDWAKRDEAGNKNELSRIGLNEEQINKLESILNTPGNNSNKLASLRNDLSGIAEAIEGLDEIEKIIKLVNDDKLVFDLTIARGLSYYTGPVWEWVINEGGVGSVGGCGRYDNLVGAYLGRNIPATGGSFGFERILEVMKERKMLVEEKTRIDVMVTVFDQSMTLRGIDLAVQFRKKGLNCFLYPEDKQMPKKLSYADKKNIRFVVILGENEIAENKLMLKDMTTGEQNMLTFDEAINKISEILIIKPPINKGD